MQALLVVDQDPSALHSQGLGQHKDVRAGAQGLKLCYSHRAAL